MRLGLSAGCLPSLCAPYAIVRGGFARGSNMSGRQPWVDCGDCDERRLRPAIAGDCQWRGPLRGTADFAPLRWSVAEVPAREPVLLQSIEAHSIFWWGCGRSEKTGRVPGASMATSTPLLRVRCLIFSTTPSLVKSSTTSAPMRFDISLRTGSDSTAMIRLAPSSFAPAVAHRPIGP